MNLSTTIYTHTTCMKCEYIASVGNSKELNYISLVLPFFGGPSKKHETKKNMSDKTQTCRKKTMRHFLVGAKGLLNSTSVGTAWLAFPRRSSNSPVSTQRIFWVEDESLMSFVAVFFLFFFGVAAQEDVGNCGVHLHVYILSLYINVEYVYINDTP